MSRTFALGSLPPLSTSPPPVPPPPPLLPRLSPPVPPPPLLPALHSSISAIGHPVSLGGLCPDLR